MHKILEVLKEPCPPPPSGPPLELEPAFLSRFYAGSNRRAVVELLWKTPMTMKELQARLPKKCLRFDWVIAAVASPISQVQYGYKLVECDGGKWKVIERT